MTATEVQPAPPLRALRRRLFPGSGTVWLTAAVVCGIGALVLLVSLLWPREVLTGSNSVGARGNVAAAKLGAPVCVRNQIVPSGTGRIRLSLESPGPRRPPIRLSLHASGMSSITGFAPSGPAGVRKVDVALAREVAGPGGYVRATLCIAPTRRIDVLLRGTSQLGIGDKPLVAGRERIPSRIALWFLPKHSERASLLSQLPAMGRRATLFRPGPTRPWMYWVLLIAVMPVLGYVSIRLLATAQEAGVRRLGAQLFVLAALIGVGWSLITPIFQAPDESEHFAAVQYFGETGHPVDSVPGKRAPWSTAETLLIDGTRLLTSIERGDVRAPWLRTYERDYLTRVGDSQRRGLYSKRNGGGYHPATRSWAPHYYVLVSPAYLATKGASVPTQVVAVRWTSALAGAGVALLAMLTILELIPAQRRLALAGGLMLGFLPQFGFMSGAINNDAGVNLLAAAVVYMTIRGLRRGFTVPAGIALGALLAVAPLMKGTGYALFPCVGLALALALVRRHSRSDVLGAAGVVAAAIVVSVAWNLASESLGRAAFATPGGDAPGVGFASKGAYLSWIWQVLVPYRPPFLSDKTLVTWPFYNIYVRRGFAGFGWYSIFFPQLVYGVITVTLAALVAGVGRLVVRCWDRCKKRWVEIVFLASVPVVVFLAVEAAYLPLGAPVDGTAEQGRYAFTALVPMAAFAVAGCLGLAPRRVRAADGAGVIATAIVGGLLILGWASWWLVMSSFYA